MKGFIRGGKFHPTDAKVSKHRYAKKGSGKSIIPRLGLKLPEREESFGTIKGRIDRDITLRTGLIEKNESIAEKISADKESEFTPSRRELFKKNANVVRDLDGDIKKNIGRLTKEERAQLPDSVQNLRRFL